MVDRRLILNAKKIGEVKRTPPKQTNIPVGSGTSKATLGDLLKSKLTDIGEGESLALPRRRPSPRGSSRLGDGGRT